MRTKPLHSSASNGQKYLYTIPYAGKDIVYRPLLRLAFAANAAMVNLIHALETGGMTPSAQKDNDVLGFLKKIGFFRPDPNPPSPADSQYAWQPQVGVLCLTNVCNLRCIYCYASAGEDRPRTLPLFAGKQVIDIVYRNARTAGEKAFSIGFHGGGEPTMALGTLKRLVAYAQAKPLPVHLSLTTNGCWPAGSRRWLAEHFDDFTISCDGLPEVHNRQRPRASQGNSFPAVMDTIRLLDRRNARYGIRMTVTDGGIDQLAQSVKFLCHQTNCRCFQVEPAFAQGRASREDTALTRTGRFSSAFLEAYDIATGYHRHLYYSGARPWLITSRFCQSPQKALIVTPEGNTTGCFEVVHESHPLSSFFFTGSIDRSAGLRAATRAKRSLLDEIARRRRRCRRCFCYWHCAGDCPAKTFSAPGGASPDGSLRCRLNRTLTRELIARNMAAGGGIWTDTMPASEDAMTGHYRYSDDRGDHDEMSQVWLYPKRQRPPSPA